MIKNKSNSFFNNSLLKNLRIIVTITAIIYVVLNLINIARYNGPVNNKMYRWEIFVIYVVMYVGIGFLIKKLDTSSKSIRISTLITLILGAIILTLTAYYLPLYLFRLYGIIMSIPVVQLYFIIGFVISGGNSSKENNSFLNNSLLKNLGIIVVTAIIIYKVETLINTILYYGAVNDKMYYLETFAIYAVMYIVIGFLIGKLDTSSKSSRISTLIISVIGIAILIVRFFGPYAIEKPSVLYPIFIAIGLALFR